MEAEVLEEGSNLNVSTHPSFFGSNVWWGSYTLWLKEVFGYFINISKFYLPLLPISKPN